MASDPNKRPHIEEVQKKLDSKYERLKPKGRARFHTRKAAVPTDWQERDDRDVLLQKQAERARNSSSLFKKFFIGALIFFVVAAIFAGITFLSGGNTISKGNISVEIFGNAFVDGGDPLPLQVEITNDNSAELILADLVIEYPKGNIETDVARIKRSLGTIKARETRTEDFEITLFGQEGDEREITATLIYRLNGSNGIFKQAATYAVALRSTPVTLSLNGVDSAIPNQGVVFEATVTSNATEVLEDMLLVVEYPPGFQFDEASPEPSFSTNVFVLGDLQPGSKRTVTFSGSLRGTQGEARTVRVFVGEQSDRNERAIATTFNSLLHTVELRNAFFNAVVRINGQEGERVTAQAGNVSGEIAWQNTLSVPLSNVSITAQFSGNALDESEVESSRGFYDSASNTMTWSRDTLGSLARVESGERGSIAFNFTPITGGSVQDPEIYIVLGVQGTDQSGKVLEAKGVDETTVAFHTNVNLLTQTRYYDGPFTNIGPMPPAVEQQTTYTLTWTVSNTSNTMSDTRVTTILPSYVNWLGTFSGGENFSYNDVSREVSWDVGDINRGDTESASFQVMISPSLSQLGRVPQLTGTVAVSGRDDFTGSTLQRTKNPHTTRLVNDSSTVGANGVVVQ